MVSSRHLKAPATKLLYKVKSSTASDGSFVYSIFSCADDVEHHRHRRNPFDPKYVQAALSSFETVGRSECAKVASREEVEAASTSVHVRVELIKSMKDGLMKLTTEAVKHCKGTTKKFHRKAKDVEGQTENSEEKSKPYKSYCERNNLCKKEFKQNVEAFQVQKEKTSLFAESFSEVETIDLGISEVLKDLECFLDENSNFLTENELCFNLNKERMETLQNISQRIVPNDNGSTYLEDDKYVDISSFKEFISPVTKDLMVGDEDSQPPDGFGDFYQSDKCMELSNTELEKVQTGRGISIQEVHVDEDFLKSSGTKDSSILGSTMCSAAMPNLATADFPDHSSPTGDDLNSVIITSARTVPTDALRQTTVHEVDLQSEQKDSLSIDSMAISDDDESMTEIVTEQEIQDDIEDGEVSNIEADILPHFILSNEDVEKFLQLRRQFQKGKAIWLMHDPEKLLLPDMDDSSKRERNNEIDECESSTQIPFMADRSMFRSALSKSGIDLIQHYNDLQVDPSKIPGALHFCSLNEEEESEDCQTTASFDTSMQEIAAGNTDAALKLRDASIDCEISNYSIKKIQKDGAYIPLPDQTSGLFLNQASLSFSLSGKVPVVSQADCWDSLPWSTGSVHQTSQEECLELGNYRDQSIDDTTQHCIGDLQSATAFTVTNDIGITLQSAGAVMAQSIISSDSCDLPTVMKLCTKEPLKSKPSCSLESLDMVQEDNSNDKSSVNDKNPKDTSMVHEDNSNDESSVNDKNPKDMSTVTKNYTLESSQPNHGIYPSEFGERIKDGEFQLPITHKKRFILNEFITGEVMAECQLQQKRFCHHDLEPLSQILSAQMSALYQKQKTTNVLLKDIVDACGSGNLGLVGHITLQRYFMAILSLAHQQNIGNLKDTNLKGFQIFLKEGCTGRLPEIVIHLLPLSQK